MFDSRAGKWIAAAVAAVALGTGAWLIHDHRAAIPPDPTADAPEAVLSYFLSDYYDRLSPAEQQRYAREMVERYQEMDEPQRERVDEAVRERRESDDDRMRDRMIEMWKGYVVTEAERYVELDPEQRPAWIASRLAVWGAFGGGPPDRGRDREGPNVAAELTDQRQRQVVEFFQEQILPRSTARERALVGLLARDVMAQQANR